MPITIEQPRFIYEYGSSTPRVQLHYMRGEETVNLFSGFHPYIVLKDSEIQFNLSYNPKTSPPLNVLLATTVEAKVRELLLRAQLQVVGDAVDHVGFRTLKVQNAHRVPGLVWESSRKPVVAESWLREKSSKQQWA